MISPPVQATITAMRNMAKTLTHTADILSGNNRCFRYISTQIKSDLEYKNVALSDLKTIGKVLLKRFSARRVWLFYGEMGAGKTTFIKALLQLLGVADWVSSPTFSMVNEYFSAEIGPVFHFDFYRIESEGAVLDIGYEDYFYSDGFCLVEWPEKIPNLLPENSLKIRISNDRGQRTVIIEA